MSSSPTVFAPRQAACATAVRATTRSARIPSTSNAAHNAAMRRNSLSGNTNIADAISGGGDAAAQLGVLSGIRCGERGGVGFERHPLADDVGTHIDVA